MLALTPASRTETPDTTITQPPAVLPPRAGARDPSAYEVAASCAAQLADVLAARRPLRQVRGRVSTRVAGSLAQHLAASPSPAPSYRIRSVHACLASRNSIEATVVVSASARSRALALRLERTGGRWICAALRLL